MCESNNYRGIHVQIFVSIYIFLFTFPAIVTPPSLWKLFRVKETAQMTPYSIVSVLKKFKANPRL